MADLDKIYEILREQGNTLAKIEQSQADTRERLFGANGQPGALHFMQTEISAANDVVAKHGKQINFWRGAIAVLTFMWTAAIAVGAAIVKRH